MYQITVSGIEDEKCRKISQPHHVSSLWTWFKYNKQTCYNYLSHMRWIDKHGLWRIYFILHLTETLRTVQYWQLIMHLVTAVTIPTTKENDHIHVTQFITQWTWPFSYVHQMQLISSEKACDSDVLHTMFWELTQNTRAVVMVFMTGQMAKKIS